MIHSVYLAERGAQAASPGTDRECPQRHQELSLNTRLSLPAPLAKRAVSQGRDTETAHSGEAVFTKQRHTTQPETLPATPGSGEHAHTYVGMPARARTSAFMAYSRSLLLTPSFIFTLSCELLSKKKPLWITNSAFDRVP